MGKLFLWEYMEYIGVCMSKVDINEMINYEFSVKDSNYFDNEYQVEIENMMSVVFSVE